jgi:hypothetical protein
MPELTPDTRSAKPESTKPHAPFKPDADHITSKEMYFETLAPQTEPEPIIKKGVDLAGRTKIIFAAGRGKTGKTTLLRWFAEMSEARDGHAILADIDPSNASCSRYFDDVARPPTDHPAGVARWLQQLIEHCITERQSAIVDLGGGDTTLRTLATEMPGTQPEDLTPAITLSTRGFATKAQALVLNEVAIDAGVTRSEAFGRLTKLEPFIRLAKSSGCRGSSRRTR